MTGLLSTTSNISNKRFCEVIFRCGTCAAGIVPSYKQISHLIHFFTVAQVNIGTEGEEMAFCAADVMTAADKSRRTSRKIDVAPPECVHITSGFATLCTDGHDRSNMFSV
jgi:hypothetical protein